MPHLAAQAVMPFMVYSSQPFDDKITISKRRFAHWLTDKTNSGQPVSHMIFTGSLRSEGYGRAQKNLYHRRARRRRARH